MRVVSVLKRMYNNYREKSLKKRLGHCGIDNNILPPCHCSSPHNVFLDDYTLIQPGAHFIMAGGKFFMKKFSSISVNAMIVTGDHKPTVGINQRILERYHINDDEREIHIDEDCWVGANVTILAGTHLQRGCIVGAGSLVKKTYQPYSVVVGVPGRIVACKFTLEQILEHERMLYPEHERMTRDELEELFATTFKGLRSIGTEHISDEDLRILREHADMQYNVY